jgi:hypothetical protein
LKIYVLVFLNQNCRFLLSEHGGGRVVVVVVVVEVVVGDAVVV